MNPAGPTDSIADDQTLPPAPESGGNGNGAPRSAAQSGPSADVYTTPCPYCGKPFRIERRKLKPGRFRLRCASCRKPFGLLVNEQMQLRIAKFADSAQPAGDQDELPPELAATLMMNRPAPPPSRRSRRTDRGDSATLMPGESSEGFASFSGPSESLSGIVTAGVTAAPESARQTGFVQPPSHAGPNLPPPDVSPGDKLNGYELTKKLGEGGMGAVYLARQMSLDRSVALKVLSPKLSGHPALVSRFMREAYAAGQLVHHNVVQIYDFGKDKPHRGRGSGAQAQEEVSGSGGARAVPADDKEIHFFSMEFVDGASLSNLVKERGRVEPREAVSLILQAARGLAFAHEHGIIHRDIKPDNLMINRQGIVKVADLGLVKQIGFADDDAVTQEPMPAIEAPESQSISAAATAQITQVSQMMGTPAYMPPEQATDAKSADARADIYSLGCTLYHLIVGHPPFGGKTLHEVLEAHRTQRVRFPEPMDGGPKISSSLKEIIRRMCGKDPKQRYSSMERVIRELEGYLEEKHQAVADPDEQQVKTLQWAAQQFNASNWARLRPLIIFAFLALDVAAIFLSAMVVSDARTGFGVAGGLIGLPILTAVFSFVLGGRRRRDVLYTKARELVFGAGVLDWAFFLLGFGLLVMWLYNFGWLVWWGAAAAAALALAWVWQAIVDKGVQADQQPMVARAERILREMREAGFEEARIRRAVAESAGKHWEGIYEALFGYEAKLQARDTYGVDEKGIEKPRYAPWRDPILAWLNERLDKRRLKRDQKFLKGLHKNELLAQGVKPDIADKAALNQARREIGQAALLREQIIEELRRELRREMLAEAAAKEEEEDEDGKKRRRSKRIKYTDEDFERIHETYFRRRFGTPMDIIMGSQVRFAIAALLIMCYVFWFGQNQQEIFETFSTAAEQTENAATVESAAPANPWWKAVWSAGEPVTLLGFSVPMLSGFHVGLAGMLMLIGAFFYGRTLAIAMFISMFAIVVVSFFMPPDLKWVPIAAGTLLWGLSVFFLRVSED